MPLKTILLLGGTGTLGSAVLNESLKEGFDVTIMNRGKRKHFITDSFKVVLCDFFDSENMKNIFKDTKYDTIVDFLSRTREDIERVYPIFATKCKQYIFISSACVYRREECDFPITESSPKPNQLWEYNIKKFESEKKLIELSLFYGTIYTIVRPYITYDDERIPFGITPAYHYHRTIIERIKAGKPWFTWDEGKAITTITHTSDFARALVGLFLNEKAFNEDFHITSGYECTQIELIKQFCNILGKETQIINFDSKEIVKCLPEFTGLLLGDRSLNASFNNSKIISALGNFRFHTDINTGLNRVIQYWDKSENYDYDYKFEAKIDKLIGMKKGVRYISYSKAPSSSWKTYMIWRNLPAKLANKLMKY